MGLLAIHDPRAAIVGADRGVQSNYGRHDNYLGRSLGPSVDLRRPPADIYRAWLAKASDQQQHNTAEMRDLSESSPGLHFDARKVPWTNIGSGGPVASLNSPNWLCPLPLFHLQKGVKQRERANRDPKSA